MARILTRPMFRKGGLSQTARPSYRGGGVTAIRPGYRGGGMNGIMSGIVPRTNAYSGYYNTDIRNQIPTEVPITSLIESYEPGFELPEWAKTKSQIIETPGGKIINVKGAKEVETIPPDYIKETITTPRKITTENGSDTSGESDADGKIKPDTSSDQDTIKSYMDMFQAALGEDQEDITRDKYLQLAKFGANILAQPGGDLTGAIGKAAASSVEGLAKTAAAQRAGKREINLAAIKTALSQMNPTELERRYDFLKSKFPDRSDIEIANMLISGETGKARTQEARITTNAESLTNLDPDKRLIVARSIEKSGIGFEQFRQLPKDKDGNIKKDKEGKLPKDGYYYDEGGNLFKIEKGQLGELGE